MYSKVIISAFLVLLPFHVKGQNAVVHDITSSFAEELASNESDPSMVQLYVTKLSDLSDEPVNLNSADEEEIARLFFLTGFQVKSIIDYVRKYGKIVSVYEVANIPGFNSEVAGMMIPYITIDDVVTENSRIPRSSFQALNNFIIRKDDRDTSSEGTDLKYLGKFKLTSGRITLGLITEKDRGEKLFYGNPPCPDFFSGYLAYKGMGMVKNLIVGDFSSKFGQGNSLNTGTASVYSLTSKGFSTAATACRGNTSADENSFLRGAAGTFKSGRFTWSLFYSSNRIDATVDPSSGSVTSFYTSGLHNTAALRLKKDAVAVTSSGIDIYADFDIARIGMSFTGTRLSLPVQKKIEPENAFSFNGNYNSVLSGYYSSVFKRNLLYGEVSFDNNLNPVLFQGVSINPSGRLTVNMLGGIVSKGYAGFYGKSPISGSSNRSEKNILGNFTFEASENLFISAGCLYTVYPWIRQGCSSPAVSVKKEARLKYMPSEDVALELICNRSLASVNADVENSVPPLIDKCSDYLRGTFRFSPSPSVSLGTRLDIKKTNLNERGYAIMQDLSASIPETPVSLWCRFCIFSAGSWNARIYAYENDLLYSFSIPAMYGEGSRSYIMMRWRLGNSGEIRFKYAVTSTSDGWERRNADEFRIQVKLVL